MNYWPTEIPSLHYSLSREFWKMWKSQSVLKAGDHRRVVHRMRSVPVAKNVLRKIEAKPGKKTLQTASTLTPPMKRFSTS